MKITVKIPKARKGKITMLVDGVSGPACMKRTAAIREHLAAEGDGLQRTADYDRPNDILVSAR